MSIKYKFFSSFSALNFTQFFTALNDNLYKLLLVFFLISIRGEENTNTILSLAGAIFVIPFIFFASLAGTLADRFSKRTIIYFTRLFEILTTSLGVAAFIFKSVFGGYIVLFLMATLSAIFSPCKYGIIPELVKKEKVPHCNGLVTATTYLAIILGTFFASFISEVTHKNFVLAVLFCVIIAIIGLLTSLGIEKTKPQSSDKKISARFLSTILKALNEAKKQRYLFSVIVFGAYFLFMGAYTQLNVISFTIQSLKLSEIQGGYLFLMTAIGIGIGSFSAGRLSGKEVELGFIPLASFGVALCFIGLFLFATNFYVVVVLMVILGVFGGFYIVPVDSYIQLASPEGERGQNVATSNFLSFIGVIIASGLIALFGNVLKLQAATGFFIVGVVTFLMAITLILIFADQVLRLFASLFTKMFCKIRIIGRNRIKSIGPTLLVAPRSSWLDTIVVMAALPRVIRYIIPTETRKKKRQALYRLLSLIPIDIEYFSPIGPPTLTLIKKELEEGHSVCLMHPADIPSANLKEWEKKIQNTLKNISVPILPIHINRPKSHERGRLSELKILTKGMIKISYGRARE